MGGLFVMFEDVIEDLLVSCVLCLLNRLTGVTLLDGDVVLTEVSDIGRFGAKEMYQKNNPGLLCYFSNDIISNSFFWYYHFGRLVFIEPVE